MPESAGQLIVYRASRLEALVPPLHALLREQGPAHPLAPARIVTGHAGMRPWLVQRLARAAGRGGIVANLDIQLPSSFLERLTQQALGESAVALAPYRREHLRWRIHALLPELGHRAVDAYLTGGDAARRRFQLADHLAALLSQYIVYRRDWLAAWAAGRRVFDDDAASPLPALWRRLRAQIGLPHRGERLQQLVDALHARAPDADDSVLHLFGISHLAPSELAVFAALAAHRPVALYLPDPCREHWMGLDTPRAELRRQLGAPELDDAGAQRLFLQQTHPLLAGWGRLGQEFLLELDRYEPLSETRHWLDAQAADAQTQPATRLERLQASIRRLDIGLLDAAPDRADASLRIHACHTRLRELEVLRDALYDALNTIDGLQPADIVVMAPDIAAYQPLLPAVFGAPGSAREIIPWHMADAPLLRQHPVLQVFARLLALPVSRLPAEDVLDLLRVPAIAARLRLEAGAVERIAGWLQQAGVAWALDGAHRAAFDVPPIAEHSFAWGVDRLLAAHVFGDVQGQAMPLPDGPIVPVAAVEGPQAADLGALDALLRQLQRWRQDAAMPRKASAWARWFSQRVDELFALAMEDRDGRAALEVLRGAIADIAEQPAQAGLDPVLAYDVVAELLTGTLQAVPQRQAFLLGGMTVCGMVPQRAIPFRVVAVLGLNDGEFPRGGGDGGLDLMARHRRLGDRDVRSDDRWLLLETVMAARDRLHLSYIGAGARDGKPRNPASPLAELMAELERHEPASGKDAEGRDIDASWRVRHPLQPFDAAYGDGRDAALFTHIRAHVLPPHADAAAPPFVAFAVDAAAPTDAPLPPVIDLAAVLQWYRDPARQLLRDVLGLRLDGIGLPLPDSEPLDARPAPLKQLGKRLLQQAVQHHDALPAEPPAAWRLDGSLPPGRIGRHTWNAVRDEVAAVLPRLRAHPVFGEGWPAALTQPPRFVVDACVIEGPAPDALGDGAHVVVPVWALGKKAAAAGLHRCARAFLQWALLRLAPELADTRIELLWLGDDSSDWCDRWNAIDAQWRDGDGEVRSRIAADLQSRLRALLRWFAIAQTTPLPYFPRTSAAALKGADKAAAEWTKERDYGHGEAALLAGDRRFEYGDTDTHALQQLARAIDTVLQPPPLSAGAP